jgi:hypothetical protein
VTTKTAITTVIAILCLGILGCGGLRFSEISPDARDFHPRRIAVLPADTTAFADAKGVVDRLFAEALVERQWFDVVGGEAIGRRLESDEAFRKAVAGYPELSGRIGGLTGTDAFLLVRVDYWNYMTENDKKLAKVSLSVTMVEAKTGKALWTAAHHKISEYLIIRPDLPDVAKDLIREMIGYMPH